MNRKNAWLLLVLIFAFVASPHVVSAVTETEANAQCKTWYDSGAKAPPPPPAQVEVTGGTVTCTCSGPKCEAQTFTNASGGTQNIGDAINFMQQALGMLQGLLGKGAGGSSGGSAPSGSPGENYLPAMAPPGASFYGGATTSADADFFNSYYRPAAKAPREIATNPAVEPSSNFLEAVAKGFSNVTDKITEVTVGIVDTQVPPPPPVIQDIQKGAPIGGRTGTIKRHEKTGTIEIGVEENSTGVAGFYGAANDEGEGMSMISRLCVSRPWSGGIFSKFIPTSFFDGLCKIGGYHVGALSGEKGVVNATQLVHQAAQRSAMEEEPIAKKKGISCKPPVLRQGAQAIIEFSCGTGDRLLRTVGFRAGLNDSRVSVQPQKDTLYSIFCSNDYDASCQIKVVNPRIILVAEPAAVRLGTRAIIRWETKDVEGETCVVKGPSFSETGSYGAASTVPISGPSTYTATCTALDGEPVIENLTVDLAL